MPTTTSTDRPVLGIDIEGPLYPWDNKPTRRPQGYQTFRFPIRSQHPRKPMRVWLRPEHGPALLALAEHYELWWISSWSDEANEFIGPALGLPTLPYVPFEPAMCNSKRWDTEWKWSRVADWFHGRDLAWIDDGFTRTCHEDRLARFYESRVNVRTLLYQADPRIGLTDADFAALADWAQNLKADA